MKSNTMTEKIKILFLALLLAFGLMLVSFFAGWKIRGEKIQMPVADTVVIHTVDTLTVTDRIRDTVTLTYWKTIQVPFSVVEVDTVVDSVRVTLPYERHFASLDSVADVWYSGYDAKIDSVVVYKHNTLQVVNNVVEVSKMPKLAFSVGAAGFSYNSCMNGGVYGKLVYTDRKMGYFAFGGYTTDFNGGNSPFFGAGIGVTLPLIK